MVTVALETNQFRLIACVLLLTELKTLEAPQARRVLADLDSIISDVQLSPGNDAILEKRRDFEDPV